MHFLNEVLPFPYFSLAWTTQKQTQNVSIHPESVNQVSLISKISKNSYSPGSIFSFVFIENLCLKQFVPSSLPPRTHFDFITTECMITSLCSQRNLLIFEWCHQEALPRWDEIVFIRTHIRTQMSSTFFGLRNWGHFAWPIRACFFLQIELAFKSRVIVEALTSECNIKLVPTLRTLKKKLPKKAGTTNWKCRLFRWPLQERRVV